MKKFILLLIILLSLIFIDDANSYDVCTGADLCSNSYELYCKTDSDGFCPEDYGDWSTCPILNTGSRCYPCDPDCKYTDGIRDPNGKAICTPIGLIVPSPVNPGSEINILASVINPILPNTLKIYRGTSPNDLKTCIGSYGGQSCLLANNYFTAADINAPPPVSVELLVNETKTFTAYGALSYKWEIKSGEDVCQILTTSADTKSIDLAALKGGSCTLRLTDSLYDLRYIDASISVSKCYSDLNCNNNKTCMIGKCNNPGAYGAFCVYTNTTANLVCTTAYGAYGVCSINGQCMTLACGITKLCPLDNNDCTNDVCNNVGLYNANCTYVNKAINSACTTAYGAYGVCNNNNPPSCITPLCTSSSQCNDYNACTIDACSYGGYYNAACSISSTITSCTNNDGCCAYGCNLDNDNNCNAVCGNGVKELGETCTSCPSDAACLPGQTCNLGVCYNVACNSNADCDDDDVCTTDTCDNPGAYGASCSNEALDCSPGICVSDPAVGCYTPACGSDADCSDGDVCTTDTCSNPGAYGASCSNSPSGAYGC